eukprot:TRINITY_DN891_c0_g1_i3.p1 TRINITY_DN891_c0_g1~~TRINITY_DN891_c0_g1_i3.p1  ORF type:complete len:1106 (+),score=305.85 TRINITY_DN891_c0_g1_i3:98-3319(+)
MPVREADVVIIGGGIGGAYAAAELCSQGLRVVLFEKCAKPGGRLLSDTDTDPGTHNKDELGGMRIFPSVQPRVAELVRRAGCTLVPVPLSDEGNLFYAGGRHQRKNAVGFNGRTPGELIQMVLAAYHTVLGTQPGAAFHCPVLRSMTVRNFLLTFGAELVPPVSPDEVSHWETYSGYNLYGDDVTAACFVDSEALYGPQLSDDQRYVREGYQQVAVRLLARSGCEVCTATEADAVRPIPGGGLLVTTRGRHAGEWRAAHVVIATGGADAHAVAAKSPVSAERREAMGSAVRQVPLFKCFLQFDTPAWWRAMGLRCGKSTTDLDIRQLHYYDDEDLLVYCGGPYAERWNERFVRDPSQALREVYRQVCELHQGAYVAPPEPQWGKCIWKFWAGGSHKWRLGADVPALVPLIADGCRDGSSVHVCGDAFSTKQGWVDGVIESVDLVVGAIGASRFGPPQGVAPRCTVELAHPGNNIRVELPGTPEGWDELLAHARRAGAAPESWAIVYRPADDAGEIILTSAEKFTAAVAISGGGILRLHTVPLHVLPQHPAPAPPQTPSAPPAPPAPEAGGELRRQLRAVFQRHRITADVDSIVATAAALGLSNEVVITDQCARRGIPRRDWDEAAAGGQPAPPAGTPVVPPPAPQAPGAPRPPLQGGECQSRCGFTVTGVAPRHCCHLCRKRAGAHGPRCARKPLAAGAAPPPRRPAQQAPGRQGSDDELSPVAECEQGGWGGSDSDEEYVSVRRPQPLKDPAGALAAAAEEKVPPVWELQPMAAAPLAKWAVHVLFQVGNAAHDVRNALRFWSALVGDGPKAAAEVQSALFRADKDAGRVEGNCRAFAGAVRTRGVSGFVNAGTRRFLPYIGNMLHSIWGNLSALEASAAAGVQRAAVERLVLRCGKYITALTAAAKSAEVDPAVPIREDEIDFGRWSRAERTLAQSMQGQRGVLGHEELTGLGRLCCNSAHEMQNLTVLRPGMYGTPAHALLQKVDNVAGQCENASRAIMVLSHHDHGRARRRVQERAAFLSSAAAEMRGLVTAAAASPQGGSSVPVAACEQSLRRLAALSSCIQSRALPA